MWMSSNRSFYAGGSNREERERQRQTDRQRDLFLFKNCLISHLVLFSVSQEALTSRLGHVSVFIPPPPRPPQPQTKKFGESKFGKLTLIANEHTRFNFQIFFIIFIFTRNCVLSCLLSCKHTLYQLSN